MMGRDHRKLTSGLPRMNWLRRGGLVVAVLGSVLLALTGSLPVGQAADSAPPRYRIQWAPCPGSATAQCGTLRVPADWSHPRGRKINLAVARRPADDPATGSARCSSTRAAPETVASGTSSRRHLLLRHPAGPVRHRQRRSPRRRRKHAHHLRRSGADARVHVLPAYAAGVRRDGGPQSRGREELPAGDRPTARCTPTPSAWPATTRRCESPSACPR